MRTMKLWPRLFFSGMVLSAALSSCKHEPMPGPAGPGTIDSGGVNQPVDTANPGFRNAILPIFIANCSGCHNDNLANDGYNFTTYEKIKAKKFFPGNPDDTRLYESITEDEEADRMPQAPNPRLASGQILLIRNWILQGAQNN
ncbi:MAG: hypothetical protein EOP54_00270 [Sphingobacteriales bacterium]|nr:MAG: hypothetical protein EOP54_00270 [Sphingobacteriales bacterium]